MAVAGEWEGEYPWHLITDPGCDRDVHRLEVYGAIEAAMLVGPFVGVETMDCGCTIQWELTEP